MLLKLNRTKLSSLIESIVLLNQEVLDKNSRILKRKCLKLLTYQKVLKKNLTTHQVFKIMFWMVFHSGMNQLMLKKLMKMLKLMMNKEQRTKQINLLTNRRIYLPCSEKVNITWFHHSSELWFILRKTKENLLLLSELLVKILKELHGSSIDSVTVSIHVIVEETEPH